MYIFANLMNAKFIVSNFSGNVGIKRNDSIASFKTLNHPSQKLFKKISIDFLVIGILFSVYFNPYRVLY